MTNKPTHYAAMTPSGLWLPICGAKRDACSLARFERHDPREVYVTDNERKEKILDRLAKLFALAERNPNKNEAQTALLMAQRLMAENAINEAEVRARGEVNEVRDEIGSSTAWDGDGGVNRDKFACDLAWHVSHHFRVKYWTRGAVINFVGYGNDRKVATMIYNFARQAMEQGAVDYMIAWKALNETTKERSRAERQSWLHGFCVGLGKGFDDQLKAHPEWLAFTEPPAEVVKWYDTELKLKSSASFSARTNEGTGAAHGFKRGEAFAKDAHGSGDGLRTLRKLLT